MFGFQPISSAPISALSIVSSLVTNSISQYVNCKISPPIKEISTDSLIYKQSQIQFLTNNLLIKQSTRNSSINILNLYTYSYQTITDSYLLSQNAIFYNLNSFLMSSILKYQVSNSVLINSLFKQQNVDGIKSLSFAYQHYSSVYAYVVRQYNSAIDSVFIRSFTNYHVTNMSVFSINTQLQYSDALLFLKVSRFFSSNNFNISFREIIGSYSSLFERSFTKSLHSQMVLWRAITGVSNNNYPVFHSESSGQYVFSTPLNIDDIITDNRKLLIKAGWGSRDISPVISAQSSIDISVPIRANGALFSVYDDRLPTVILQDPVAVSYSGDIRSQNVLSGVVPTAKTRVKSFKAPLIEKTMQLIELPKTRKL